MRRSSPWLDAVALGRHTSLAGSLLYELRRLRGLAHVSTGDLTETDVRDGLRELGVPELAGVWKHGGRPREEWLPTIDAALRPVVAERLQTDPRYWWIGDITRARRAMRTRPGPDGAVFVGARLPIASTTGYDSDATPPWVVHAWNRLWETPVCHIFLDGGSFPEGFVPVTREPAHIHAGIPYTTGSTVPANNPGEYEAVVGHSVLHLCSLKVESLVFAAGFDRGVLLAEDRVRDAVWDAFAVAGGRGAREAYKALREGP